jgi:hypothetical protein
VYFNEFNSYLEFNYITPENIDKEMEIISDNKVLMNNYKGKEQPK